MIQLSSKNQKARVTHLCDFCNQFILPNEVYNLQNNKQDG